MAGRTWVEIMAIGVKPPRRCVLTLYHYETCHLEFNFISLLCLFFSFACPKEKNQKKKTPSVHALRGTTGGQRYVLCWFLQYANQRCAGSPNEPATRRSFFFPILSFCSLVVASIWRRYARSLFQLRSTIRLLMV